MKGKRSKEIVSYNMSKIRSQGTKLEAMLEAILKSVDCSYVSHPDVYGKPDFAYLDYKIAIFADSDFWHGYDWKEKKKEIKTNVDFWVKEIERNINRDIEVNSKLREDGWAVIRLWGHDIIKNADNCRSLITNALKNRRT